MKPAVLQTKSYGNILIRADAWEEGKVFFECLDPEPFLKYITDGSFNGSLSSDSYVKGVYIPEEGAYFELFHSLSSQGQEVCHLSKEASQERIFDVILWRV